MSSHVSESPEPTPAAATSSTIISEHEFACHCCYDILVNPTTLTCGHNFCRHCLALWWESSHKNECPECREKWEGFPKVNILLRCAFRFQMRPRCSPGALLCVNWLFILSRDATNKLFSDVIQQRRAEIQANPKILRSLLAFQR